MKKAFIQLHIAVFLAGFTAVFGRLITVNEGLIVWYRLFFTAVTMWLLFGQMKKIQKISNVDIGKISGIGIIAMLHWVTFYASIKYANISVALVCFSAIGFFTAILEPIVLRKRVNKMELLLGLLTIAGIYIIFRFDTQYKTGIIIGIISTFLAALFPILNREQLQNANVETVLVWQQTGGLIGLSLLMPLYLHWFPVESFLPGKWDMMWLLVLSWLCSVLAFYLSFNALKKLSAFTVNLTYNLEPVYGIILAFIIYNENEYLSKWFYYGFALIALALIIHVMVLLKQERNGALRVS